MSNDEYGGYLVERLCRVGQFEAREKRPRTKKASEVESVSSPHPQGALTHERTLLPPVLELAKERTAASEAGVVQW